MDISIKIETLLSFCEEWNQKVLQKEVHDLLLKYQDEKFYAAFLGLFKRGKSTIINGLLGENILPSAVIPVTSIITLIEHADLPSSEIYFSNGISVTKEITEIENFIAEEKNPANEKEIDFVKVYYPAPILKNISIVDTPGIGSVLPHNSETTKSFIPKIDVAVYIVSADMPVTQTDLNFIKELKQNVPKILFVLNKADLLNEADLKKMVGHNLTAINKITEVSDDQLIIISAKNFDKAEGNFEQISSELIQLASTEKKELLQQSVLNRFGFLRNQLKNELQFLLKMMMMPLKELEEKKNILQSSVEIMTQQKEEFESVMNGKIKSLQQYIHQAMNDEGKLLTEAVNEQISHISKFVEKDINDLTKEIDALITNKLETIKASLEEKTKESFKNLLMQSAGRSENFLHELSTNLNTYLGYEFELISEKFDLDVYTSFYLTVNSSRPTGASEFSIFNKLLPAGLRKKQLIKKLEEHYHEIIVTDTASIGYDLQYKIQESFRKFNYDLNNRLKELLSNLQQKIEDTIASKKINEEASEAEINRVTESIGHINNLE